MSSVQLSELGPLADRVRNGETVEIRDGEKVVARVVPTDSTAEEHIDRLVREGKATRGTGRLPDWFFEEPPPDLGGNVVEQLLSDRRKNDW